MITGCVEVHGNPYVKEYILCISNKTTKKKKKNLLYIQMSRQSLSSLLAKVAVRYVIISPVSGWMDDWRGGSPVATLQQSSLSDPAVTQ